MIVDSALQDAIRKDDTQAALALLHMQPANALYTFSWGSNSTKEMTALDFAIATASPNTATALLEDGAKPTAPISYVLRNVLNDGMHPNQIRRLVNAGCPPEAYTARSKELFRLLARTFRPAYDEALCEMLLYAGPARAVPFVSKPWFKLIVEEGLPQHDASKPYGLRGPLELLRQSSNSSDALLIMMKLGIDFSPLFAMPPEELAQELCLGDSHHLVKTCATSAQASALVALLNPLRKEAKKQVKKWLHPEEQRYPSLEQLLQPDGKLKPETWQVLSSGFAPHLLDRNRWPGRERECALLADGLRTALPRWWQENLDRQVDFAALHREAAASEVAVSSWQKPGDKAINTII